MSGEGYIFTSLWLADRTVKTYRIVLKSKFSSLNKINLDWLRFIIRYFAAITIIAMVHKVIPALGNNFSLYASLILLPVFTFFFINRVLVKALNQPAIFAGIEMEDGKEKYAGSGLSEKVKRLLAISDPKVTVLEIMYEAGFSSKSSFNKEFKKLNWITPTEFRRSLQ